MNSITRALFSVSIGPGLTVFTACSAYFNGPLAFATIVGFAFTVVYGIVEIACQSYTPISSIELDGPSLLEDDAEEIARSGDLSVAPSNIVRFPGPPEHTIHAA